MKLEWRRVHSGKYELMDMAALWRPAIRGVVKRTRTKGKNHIRATVAYDWQRKSGFATLTEAKDWVMAQLVAKMLEDEP